MQRRLWVAIALIFSLIGAAEAQAPLPNGAVARLGVHRLRARSVFDQACAITPDSRRVAAIDNRDVVLYDMATGLEADRLGVANARYFVMAADVPRILLYTGAGFELWDVAKKQCLRSWPRRLVNIDFVSMAISPDGTQFVASVDNWNTLRWNEDSPTMAELMQKYTWSHTFSGDGKKIFCIRSNGPKSEVLVYDVSTNRELAQLHFKVAYITIAPCGTKAARSSSGEPVVVADLDPGAKPDFAVKGPTMRTRFSRDGKRLVVFGYNTTPTRVWDIATKKVVATLPGIHAYSLLSPDGRSIVSVAIGIERPMRASQEQIHVWDVSTGKRVRYREGHPYFVGGLAWAPDGKRIASFSHDTILIFDAASGKELRQWIAQADAVTHVAFSPDGKSLASASARGALAFWNPDTGKELRRINIVPQFAALDKDDTLARRLGIAGGNAMALAYARDGKTVMTCLGRTVQTWEIATGKLLRTDRYPDPIFSPLLAPTGQCFVAARTFPYDPFEIRFTDALAGRSRPGPASGKTNQAFAFAPDGTLFATTNVEHTPNDKNVYHSVRIFETRTRGEIMRIGGLPSCPNYLALAPDNRTVAFGVEATVSKYANPGTDVMFRDISQATTELLGMELNDESAKQRWLQGQRLLPLSAHHGTITCMSFSPDGKRLATGGMGGVIYVWDVAHFHKTPPLPARQGGELAALWRELADADAGKAHRAIAQLEASPRETIAFLRQHVKPAPPVDEKAILQHLRDLGNESFAVRQKASNALEKAADVALPFVRAELRRPIPLENKRRLEVLVEKLEDIFQSGDHIRTFRALVLLKRIATPEARGLLEELARGAPDAWLTEEARHALR